ncbi:protein-lysine N-methyltransferase EEF2KMT-like isoform X2 [Actinia tenebrosa]|uniref:Protein-lysine N-methyltransferase EEF2KMT-like isoform X2 n=1 Tax=Actinia tenebrosa TaxID=6105 RepID=A0A6P8I423_ACTTE|nr:protein-lysine N-methyltransferase EEF2KMT-like isoform X2 [Actinia tenebrosa]
MAANMKTEEQEQQEILFSIQKQYFQMVPIKFFDWKNIAQYLDSTLQKVILRKTYMSNEFVKYTPSIRYKRMFLKQLMKISEEANHELVDELYECYAEVISEVDDDQSPCYKTYILPSGSGIIVEESQNIISQGTTGLSTWQAALYMLEWVLENSKEFENRNVVELGCGLGLLGLSICMSYSPQHYVFTDCHEAVLGKLNKNLSINGFQRNADSNCYCGTEDETVLPKCPRINKRNKLIGSNWTFDLAMNNGCNDRFKDTDNRPL